MPFAERKEILENIKGVDCVVAGVENDQTVTKTLEILKPDVFAKGGDRTRPENIPEAEPCGKWGVNCLPISVSLSTPKVI